MEGDIDLIPSGRLEKSAITAYPQAVYLNYQTRMQQFRRRFGLCIGVASVKSDIWP
jgi:hypothetical protein